MFHFNTDFLFDYEKLKQQIKKTQNKIVKFYKDFYKDCLKIFNKEK